MRALLLLLLLPASAGFAGEALVARLDWEPAALGPRRYVSRPLAKNPSQKPAGARFGTIVTAAGTVHLAIDAQDRNLFVDHDLDGDLSGEKGHPLQEGAARATVLFPLGGAAVAVPIRIRIEAPDRFGYRLEIHRRGVVELAGRLRPLALVDGNGDLRFDDPESDRIYCDLDGTGRLCTVAGSHEEVTAGEPFRVRGRGFLASVPDGDGATVAFAPVAPVPKARQRFFERWPSPARKPSGPPAEPLDALAKRYKTAGPQARILLIDAIARYSTSKAFALLTKIALSAPEVALRKRAVWGLHYAGAPGRARTYASLLKSATDRRLVADTTACLARIGTPQARKRILRVFRNQSDPTLRRQIYSSATHAGGLWPPLVKAALEDVDGAIAGDALFDAWGQDAAAARARALALLPGDGSLREPARTAILILGYQGDRKAVEKLLATVRAGSGGIWSLVLAVLRPVRDPAAVRVITQGLADSSNMVRALCAHLVEDLSGARVTAALVAALRREKDPDIVWRLVSALSAQSDERAVAELLRIAARTDFPARSVAVAGLVRIGFRNPFVAAFFTRLLDSRRWKDRIYALDAVARAGAKKLAPKVISNLSPKHWQVRLAAAQALARVRVREAIPALITLLENEENRRVRVAAAEALFRLTGNDLFDDAGHWKRWWAERGPGFAVPERTPERVTVPGRTSARFFGVPVYSDHVCFLLDRSGSMGAPDVREGSRTRLQRAAEELLGAAGRLAEGARVNVIYFGSEIESWRKTLTPLTASARAALEKLVGRQNPAGDTDLWGALDRAFQDRSVDTIYLLTDGRPSRGKWLREDSILRELLQLNQTRRVAIHCVSIGRDSHLLRAIADQNGGTYVRR